MTPLNKFYYLMGFLDLLEIYSKAAPQPQDALLKRMYIQERAIPGLLPDVDPEEVKKMITELKTLKLSESIIEQYMKPRVNMYKVRDIISQAKYTDLKRL